MVQQNKGIVSSQIKWNVCYTDVVAATLYVWSHRNALPVKNNMNYTCISLTNSDDHTTRIKKRKIDSDLNLKFPLDALSKESVARKIQR